MRPTPLASLVCTLSITVGLGALYMTPPPTAATPQAASLYGLLTEPWGAQGFQEVLGASGVEIPSPAALHAAYFGPAVDRHHDLDTVRLVLSELRLPNKPGKRATYYALYAQRENDTRAVCRALDVNSEVATWERIHDLHQEWIKR